MASEIIADIIAEKRRRADEIERDCAEKMERGEMISDCYARELVADIRREADRLEAAHRREKTEWVDANAGLAKLVDIEKIGNCAKLREAMVEILGYIESFHKYIIPGKRKKLTTLFAVADTIRDKARAALAAPPRNCDIYLTEEAVDAATVTVRDCEACPRIDMEAPCVFCMVRWLLAPAKEGGAK